MGYGAGHDIKLNCQDGYALYNGRNLVIVPEDSEIDSWDMTHPMDGMTNIKPELLKITFNRVVLSQDDKSWLKHDGITKGEKVYFTWEDSPEGMLWSGYCRSPLNKSFPIDLKGTIRISGLGSYDVIVTINMKDKEEFKIFIDDVLDYYPDDESCQAYIKEEEDEEMTVDKARIILHEINDDSNRENYGA